MGGQGGWNLLGVQDGISDKISEGSPDGCKLWAKEGRLLVASDGSTLGSAEGTSVGISLGAAEGAAVSVVVSESVGKVVGGAMVGAAVGVADTVGTSQVVVTSLHL